MRPDDPRVHQLRRAYEMRRLRRALPWLLPVSGLAALAWAWGSTVSAALGPLAAIALVWSQWRGGSTARGGLEGLASGGLAYAVLGAWCQVSTCSGPHCFWFCAFSGAMAAVFLGFRMDPTAQGKTWVSLLIASLVVCLPAGVFGLVGFMVPVAFWGFGVPIAWVLPRAA